MPAYNTNESEQGIRRFVRARSFIWQGRADITENELVGSTQMSGLIEALKYSEPESVDSGIYIKRGSRITIAGPADTPARQITIFEFRRQHPMFRVVSR